MVVENKHRLLILAFVTILSEVSSCKVNNPIYCDEDTACTHPMRTFCDIDGIHSASGGIRNTCITAPIDAGSPDAMEADAALPCFKRIAFVSERDGGPQIYTMTTQGDDIVRLTDTPKQKSGLQWSLDGNKIYYYDLVLDGDGATLTSEIRSVDVTSLDIQNITSFGISNAFVQSSNGLRIYYSDDNDDDFEIYSSNVDGSGVYKLTDNSIDDHLSDVSSNGEQILFWNDSNGMADVFVMNSDGSNQRNLSNHADIDYWSIWSRDSSFIGFISYRDGKLGLYSMNADGSGQQLVAEPDVRSILHGFWWDWSPTDDRILFVDRPDSQLGEIWVVNADGSNLTNLTNTPSAETWASWSPDGEQIAYQLGPNIGDIYIMNADGSGQTNLTDHPASDTAPAFSPCLPKP